METIPTATTTIANDIWSKSKVLVKAGIIGILILLLLIPTNYVEGLIQEREARQKEAIAEVSQKWAGKQTITGPILTVPYITTAADANGKLTNVKKYAYFLPDQLQVDATVNPQEKHRGIYKVMLYNALVNLKGQ